MEPRWWSVRRMGVLALVIASWLAAPGGSAHAQGLEASDMQPAWTQDTFGLPPANMTPADMPMASMDPASMPRSRMPWSDTPEGDLQPSFTQDTFGLPASDMQASDFQ